MNTLVEPELSIEHLKVFIKENEHKFHTNHKILCFAVIKRIYRRVILGYRFGAIKVCERKLVVDGNHRYIAYTLAGIDFEIVDWTSNSSDELGNFNSITIDCVNDWDNNHCLTKKYCCDDFLKYCEKIE